VKSAGYPGAVAFLSDAEITPFLTRFLTCGTPAPWHAGSLVKISVHGLDLADEQTRSELAPIARGRWFWATPAGEPALVDASTGPPPRLAHAAGGSRADRRRQERAR
jgi:hypothetical protein